MKCACGCEEEFEPFDSRGRPRRFIKGHFKGARTGKFKIDSESTRTGRSRARKMTDTSTCCLNKIGGCGGRVEVHHRDRDPLNNAPDNRFPLCTSHHRLVEIGRIDLDNPIMPEFVIKGGKRRYLHTYPHRLTRSESMRAAWARRREEGRA